MGVMVRLLFLFSSLCLLAACGSLRQSAPLDHAGWNDRPWLIHCETAESQTYSMEEVEDKLAVDEWLSDDSDQSSTTEEEQSPQVRSDAPIETHEGEEDPDRGQRGGEHGNDYLGGAPSRSGR